LQNLNINIADYGHIQQHHHPVEFDQTGQQPMMSAQIIAAQNGSQFNASPQQWAQSQSQHKPYQQRNMGQ
jgi:hypothetical protein